MFLGDIQQGTTLASRCVEASGMIRNLASKLCLDVIKQLLLFEVGSSVLTRIRLALPGDELVGSDSSFKKISKPAEQVFTHGIAFATADEVVIVYI
jgi:hypothetical protein